MNKWISRADVAKRLGTSVDTFDRSIRGHPEFPKPRNITGTREGLRWNLPDVDEWVERQPVAA